MFYEDKKPKQETIITVTIMIIKMEVEIISLTIAIKIIQNDAVR